MVSINPIDLFLWTFRRNEKDVVKLYTSLSPIMQLATGGSMLNFGLWSKNHSDPIAAQNNLCMIFADMAELSSAIHVADVGSGLSSPSKLWRDTYSNLRLYDVNTNFKQLTYSGQEKNIEFFNSTSTKLPFVNNSLDRVLALESAQHFKPFDRFIDESYRILQPKGLLVIAMPVTVSLDNVIKKLFNLGILNLTWSSEHYGVEYIKSAIQRCRFKIMNTSLIGTHVFEPLAHYYIENRREMRQKIMEIYPSYIENILYKSLVKMMAVSKKGLIEYIILQAQKL